MSEQRYKVQTWVRRNSDTLATLQEPLNDLAVTVFGVGLDAVNRDPSVDLNAVELTEDNAERIQAVGRQLANAAQQLRGLPDVPDPVAAALLVTAIDAYRAVGEAVDDLDTAAIGLTLARAGEAFERFAQ